MVSLEIASDVDHDDMIDSVVCNHPPRVGEYITLLGSDRPGRYHVTGIDHVFDAKRLESVQHVCVYVVKADRTAKVAT